MSIANKQKEITSLCTDIKPGLVKFLLCAITGRNLFYYDRRNVIKIKITDLESLEKRKH